MSYDALDDVPWQVKSRQQQQQQQQNSSPTFSIITDSSQQPGHNHQVRTCARGQAQQIRETCQETTIANAQSQNKLAIMIGFHGVCSCSVPMQATRDKRLRDVNVVFCNRRVPAPSAAGGGSGLRAQRQNVVQAKLKTRAASSSRSKARLAETDTRLGSITLPSLGGVEAHVVFGD